MAAAAAGMTAAAASVAAAAVFFTMIMMMIAVEIGIDSQCSVDKGCGNFIHIAGCAADQLNPGFRQRLVDRLFQHRRAAAPGQSGARPETIDLENR